jgi:hypothetical protein
MAGQSERLTLFDPANDRICVQGKSAPSWNEDFTTMISMIMQPTFNQARAYLRED